VAVLEFLAGDVAPVVLGELVGGPLPVVGRRPRDVWRDEDVLEPPEWRLLRQWLLGEHVERGAPKFAGVERLDQRVLVDHLAAGDVDEHTLAERGERVGVDRPPCLLVQRTGEDGTVRPLQGVVETVRGHAVGECVGRVRGVPLDADGPRPEGVTEFDHPRPDGADADDHYGSVGEFARPEAVPLPPVLLGDRPVEPPLEVQQRTEDVLADGLGVDARTVREDQPALGQPVEVEVVEAGRERVDPAEPRDGLQ